MGSHLPLQRQRVHEHEDDDEVSYVWKSTERYHSSSTRSYRSRCRGKSPRSSRRSTAVRFLDKKKNSWKTFGCYSRPIAVVVLLQEWQKTWSRKGSRKRQTEKD